MINLRALFLVLLLCAAAGARQAAAQALPNLEIEGRTEAEFNTNGFFTITNGLTAKYTDLTGTTVLTADKGTVNYNTGDIFAEGNVKLQRDAETWKGDRLHYNYQTKEMDGENFRLGNSPFYASGKSMAGVGEGTNGIYHGTNVTTTTDDYFQPYVKVRAKQFTIVPGNYVAARDATLYLGAIPVFYFPYYRQSLVHDPNHFTFLPGYRSAFGPYLLSSYYWTLNDQLSGAVHADYRETRGFGVGPDLNLHLGQFGEANFQYYYTHDHDPGTDPYIGTPIPRDRERTYFSYIANPLTNLTIQSQVDKQSDPYVTRDFFESRYNDNIQPNTHFDVNQFWQNWSVDALVQPRLNPYWETVERLPDVRLTGFKQQILDTPLYYESQSSIGYFRRLFSDTNTLSTGDFSGSRADTFHQITMPETFFGWLNFTPRVGGRFTYYDSTSGPGATTTNQYRGVFNTGAELSFTASRVWPTAQSTFWDADGIRHIFQPSMNYVYVPQPNVRPNQLPQFDYQLTNNLRLLPIDFPGYNDIDSIDSRNTIRYGIENRIQTKRNGEVEDLVDWDVYMDWNLRPNTEDMETTFSDIYSDFTIRPRSWWSFNSSTRYSIENEQFNLAQHSFTFQPNSTWNWTIGHLYLRDGPLFGQGDNLYTSVFFYKFDENWGTRFAHYFDASSGTLQEQDYTIYRDMRSWTAALTFRELNSLNNGKDYGVSFSFSFKSFPRFALGQDTVRAANLVGY